MRYIADHGLAEVTYEEFKSLIEKIDLEVVARHSSLELAHMTRALFDFVESGKMMPQIEFEQQTLPINAAIVFFGDKNIADICTRLEFERDNNRILQITSDRLADIIEIVRTGNEEATAHMPAATAPTGAEQVSEPVVTVNVDRTEQAQKIMDVLQSEEKSVPQKPPLLVFGENDEQYLTSMPSVKQKEILDLFSSEEFALFVKKLFASDEPAFRGSITEISLLRTWEHVAQYLDKLFVINQIDPFSVEAVGFTDKLYVHFHPPGADKEVGGIS